MPKLILGIFSIIVAISCIVFLVESTEFLNSHCGYSGNLVRLFKNKFKPFTEDEVSFKENLISRFIFIFTGVAAVFFGLVGLFSIIDSLI